MAKIAPDRRVINNVRPSFIQGMASRLPAFCEETIMSDSWKFPSGRSVGNCRKDAKRLARQEKIPLNEALDRIASANGTSLPWPRALLILGQSQPSTHMKLDEKGVKYLRSAPLIYTIRAKYLTAGMLHVAQFERGAFEVARIRNISVVSADSLKIDLGPEGHANRIVGPDQYVDIPVLSCPKCNEKKHLSTELHPGTSFVRCDKCGHKGPEFLPRGDEHALLAVVIHGWNRNRLLAARGGAASHSLGN
jgi:hypothetical protein